VRSPDRSAITNPAHIIDCVRRAPLVVLAAGCALFALTAASCQDTANDIGLGNAGRADVVEVIDAPATVTAKAVATLTAPADGTVVALPVLPGATVRAGDVVAIINSPSAQSRLDQAAAALASASGGGGGGIGRTNLVSTQRNTDEAAAKAFASARDAATRIADPNIRTALLAQIDAAQRGYEEAAASSRALINSVQRGFANIGQAVGALTAAQRTQAQAAYDLAKSTVDALTLRAPVAGVLQLGGVTSGGGGSLTDLLGSAGSGGGALSAAIGGAGAGGSGGAGGGTATGPGIDPATGVGGVVGAGTPVVTIVDTSELGLLAEVDETDVLLVKPGVKASAELDAAPGTRYDATVGSVDVLPAASSRGGVSYRVRLSLRVAEPAPVPRPGMNAVAHLAVRSVDDAVTVPAAAVFNAEGHDAVWVVRGGKAARVPVSVGVAGQDRIQIVSGLSDSDRVVVRGTDKVRAGQQLP
jgi:multidrug efflux pump subunit AcrA (membrane-fusion protein)